MRIWYVYSFDTIDVCSSFHVQECGFYSIIEMMSGKKKTDSILMTILYELFVSSGSESLFMMITSSVTDTMKTTIFTFRFNQINLFLYIFSCIVVASDYMKRWKRTFLLNSSLFHRVEKAHTIWSSWYSNCYLWLVL